MSPVDARGAGRQRPAQGSSGSAGANSPKLSGVGRFDERRRSLAEQADQRRLRTVAALAAVTTLALVVIAILNSAWFDVDQIVVVGDNNASPDEIVTASEILPGDRLLSVDLDGAAARVEQEVPWVAMADVDRSWRGTITVTVTEREPLAAIAVGDRFVLVDVVGRQLEVVAARPTGFLPISGIEGTEEAGDAAPAELYPLLALLEAMPQASLDRVAAAELGPDGLSLVLETDDARVLFGDGQELTEKLRAFETVLARVDTSCLALLDVRVPAAPVVRRQPLDGGTETASQAEVPDSAAADC
jgi:cell division protein FtsQ